MHRPFLIFPTGLLLLVSLAACATPYGLYADKRPLEVVKDDSMLRSRVGDALRAQGYTGVNELTVHAYFGKVFVTGEVPENQRDQAVQTAKRVRGVKSVTPHWFTSLQRDTESDAAIKLRLEKNLVGASGVTSSRVDYVVNSGRVVLLGVVGSDEERKLAIKAARATSGVRAVTSYLFIHNPGPAPVQQPQAEQKGTSV